MLVNDIDTGENYPCLDVGREVYGKSPYFLLILFLI